MSTPAAFGRHLIRSFVIAAGILAVGSVAQAAAKAEVDPKAQKVIDDWGKYVQGLRGFQYEAAVELSIEQAGKKQNQNFTISCKAERPNKLAYTVDAGAQGGATIVCDGSDLTVSIKALNRYASEKAPETWAGMMKIPLVAGPLSFGNASAVTAALFDDKPAEKLLEKASAVKYGGTVDVDGTKCHLIEASGDELDWQLWVTVGPQPAPRKFVPDLAKTFAKMAQAQKGKNPLADLKVSNVLTFKDWKGDPKFAPDAFEFEAPEGSEKAKSLMDIIASGRNRPEPGPHPLVGQAAPEIKLDQLDGGKFDLAELKGKVVILDFWATWCGPCVQAMPIIEKVAEKYKDKGVLLFAVNLQEEPDDVKKFLEAAELNVTVPLDKEGTVARAYKADAIPQTVLVGKDGSVQVVRIGLSPNLEDELVKDLDALVAGKNVAAETLKAAKERKEKAAKADEEGADDDGESEAKKADKKPDAPADQKNSDKKGAKPAAKK
jgi:thiol-disulfide isomerase/thioredoxin